MIDIDSWRRKVWLFLLLLTSPAVCSAQVVQLHTSTGKGTAVCVGETESDGQLFVTCRHNFENGSDGRILFKGRWYAVDNLQISDEPGYQNDLACFTSQAETAFLPLYRGGLSQGAQVEVPGFGPYFNRRSSSQVVRHGRLEDLELVVNQDEQVVPGDSGCPVVYENRTVGIVRAFFDDSPRETQIIPAMRVERFLTRCQWQCQNGRCYIRQRIRQPIAGVVIPIGPPQIETQIIPAPAPVQPRQVPQPIPDENFESPKTVQGPRGERGPQGERGEKGPPGRDGADGRDGSGPDPKQVEQIVVAWLEANRDQLKGDPGKIDEIELQTIIDMRVMTNERLRDRITKMIEDQLKNAPKGSDTSGLEKRLSAIEKRPLKVVITEDGKIKDEENYLPGEPVVFDLARLRAK